MNVPSTSPLRVVLPAIATASAVIATSVMLFADASAQSGQTRQSGVQPVQPAGVFCNFAIDTDGTNRSLIGNGIPNHAVGEFPNDQNPTGISEQAIDRAFTLTPTLSTTGAIPEMTPGYALNSIKFEPATAGTCTDAGECDPTGSNGGRWRMEALTSTALDRGKQRPSMKLVGWAVDGYPIYARYGYVDSPRSKGAQGGKPNLKVLKGSYQLKTTPDAGRPSVEVYNMGSFNQDWVYVAGSGDLDECNGRTGVTPEFPRGTYYYAVTDSYPFIQRCPKGVDEGGQPPPPMG
jgi:hypothetical protein